MNQRQKVNQICKNCINRGKDLKDSGFLCLFYKQLTLFEYEDMIVDCEGWVLNPSI